ncbi:MAG: 50S ribosomal protein L25 [Candidatus Paceibacterota bacterium]
MLVLEVQPRDSKESTETLRSRGAVPAVFYGPKEASTSIAINARKLESVWKAAGETTIITLKGAGEDKDTLIHDVQVDPVTSVIIHADFYVLEKGKKIKINIPLEFTGVASAEKAGHIVVKALHEIEIEVAPQELPHSLPVDLGVLANVGDHITVAQIKLPASAELITGADEIVASVTAFVEEKVEEPAPAAEGAEGAAPAEGAEGAAAAPAEGEAKPKSE